ncbi:Stc1 domain-containing protein [Jackrogersella minutella]|nr:Stc1 domain-containing protein [Jackrogersella minutella]
MYDRHVREARGQGNKATSTPQTFMCAIDGKWLTSDKFSNNQLCKWDKKKRFANDGVTPENIGLVCKEHSQQNVNRELHCCGPCHTWKPRDSFSKNQRNVPNPWCINCTCWITHFGGNEVPGAPPGAQAVPRDELMETSTTQHQDSDANTIIHDATDATSNQLSGITLGILGNHTSLGIDDAHADNNVGNLGSTVVGSAVGPLVDLQNYAQGGLAASSSTIVGGEGMLDVLSTANSTNHGTMREEMTSMRNPAARMASTLQFGRRGPSASVASSTSHLYSYVPFSPQRSQSSNVKWDDDSAKTKVGDGSVANTPEKSKPRVVIRTKTRGDGNWAKVDQRKVFYADSPANTVEPASNFEEPRDEEWDSEDEAE